jgi:hypothetical protein
MSGSPEAAPGGLVRRGGGAFLRFGGVPAEVLIDNAKALVEHHDAVTREVRFNTRLHVFARYWGFTPRARAEGLGPKADGIPIRLVRFTDRQLKKGVETHPVEGVPVKVFGVAKTVADCFRFRNKIGLSGAIEGLREVLRLSKTTPGEIVRQAERGAVYLEALTANG